MHADKEKMQCRPPVQTPVECAVFLYVHNLTVPARSSNNTSKNYHKILRKPILTAISNSDVNEIKRDLGYTVL